MPRYSPGHVLSPVWFCVLLVLSVLLYSKAGKQPIGPVIVDNGIVVDVGMSFIVSFKIPITFVHIRTCVPLFVLFMHIRTYLYILIIILH